MSASLTHWCAHVCLRSSQQLLDADTLDQPPLVAPTTLNVVRFAGRYLNMMVYLPHIAFGMAVCIVFRAVRSVQSLLCLPCIADIALGMAQLFDFYQYAMYTFFGAPPTDPPGTANTLTRSTTTPNYYATSSYASILRSLTFPTRASAGCDLTSTTAYMLTHAGC